MNNQLTHIRTKLDRIDIKILRLIKNRQKLINEVIKIKSYKKNIIDKNRIKKILKKIKKESIKMGVNSEVSEKIWKQMIKAFIAYEFKFFSNFKKK